MAHSFKKLLQLSLLFQAALLSCACADPNIVELQIKIADVDEAQLEQGTLKVEIFDVDFSS